MSTTKKAPVLVVVQLSGGNDFMNTLIPYTSGIYHDSRPVVGIKAEDVLPSDVDDALGWHPHAALLKKMFDAGEVAVVQGIGYPDANRSHFRAMDIWHTCEPDIIGTEGWLGRALKDMDPNSENVLTGVNFGRGLPRALAKDGVPVASVGNLETYGLLTGIDGESQRTEALDVFGRMYSPAMGRGAVLDYIHRTGTDALKGADILATAPDDYSSTVEYSNTAVGQYMKNIAQTHLAEFGTRVLFTTSPYNGFDTHAAEATAHAALWSDVSDSVETFFADLRDHGKAENTMLFMFSEFGRRIFDNGSGTDHGAASVAFAVGDKVKGGIYGVYPSMERRDHIEGGNLAPTMDFRQVYATIVEDWFGQDPVPVIGGNFEKIPFL
jgi:uncharacterized protein (DUF1501 family)